MGVQICARRTLGLFAGLLMGSSSFAAQFTTERFDVTLRVQADGELSVTERIDVKFTNPQHGLVRQLPQVTRNGIRTRQVEFLQPTAERREGGRWLSEPIVVSEVGGDVRFRIGSSAVTHFGSTQYRLSYRVNGALTTHNDRPLWPQIRVPVEPLADRVGDADPTFPCRGSLSADRLRRIAGQGIRWSGRGPGGQTTDGGAIRHPPGSRSGQAHEGRLHRDHPFIHHTGHPGDPRLVASTDHQNRRPTADSNRSVRRHEFSTRPLPTRPTGAA